MFGNFFSLSSLICLFFLFQSPVIRAQQNGNSTTQCGSSLLFKPENAAQRQKVDNDLYVRSISRSGEDTTHYRLPLAVHIVHQDGQENISDIDVFAAIDLLNKAFRNQIPFDPASGADINIGFCLSPGAIKRYKSPLTNVMLETQDVALKQVGIRDPNKYINIWVVKSISSVTHGSAVGGYATMSHAHGTPTDGIVVKAEFMNGNPDNLKVLIHEMGHYLGLYHTFENGCGNNDCLLDGDRVCDTPPDQSIAGVNCNGTINTCYTDSDDASANNPFRSVALGGLGDQPDMFQNYMDYGFRQCQNRFTLGQRTRMRNALLTQRTSLVDAPGACTTCDNPIIATLDIPDTLLAGVPYHFALNPNQTGLDFFWIIDDVFSTADTATIMYPRAGTVTLIRSMTNPAAPECNLIFRDTIVFTCAVPEPAILVSTVGPYFPGETVTFSTADNGYTYTWFIDGLQVGVGSQLNYTINGTHGRMLTLMAGNDTCQSSSDVFYINPGTCGPNKQNNVWHFGLQNGIDFNTNPPTSIVGSTDAAEGCAVICDDDGNAMYSSNGEVVKDAQTGAILTNGSSLKGSTTTTQSALFVPRPGSNRYIYLFTLDYQAGVYATDPSSIGGLYYSVIDKQTNEVTTKNHMLSSFMTEKMTAVRNRTGNGIWVIAHKWDTNEFYAWQVTSYGVSGTPVISSVGSVHSGHEPGFTSGEMKASPSGDKVALTIRSSKKTEVFDFNTATGKLSNPVSLTTNALTWTYGVAFSPNERFLYVSSIQGRSKIIRYDLHAGNEANIQASEVLISDENPGGGGIQLAPDGKIYVNRQGAHYLGVISNPNAPNPSDCRYEAYGFRLWKINGRMALPNPIQSVFAEMGPHITGAEKVCLTGAPKTETYTFEPKQNATYTWIYNGINSHTVLNDTTLEITFTQTGPDTVILKRTTFCGDSFDTLFVTAGPPPTVFDLGPDVIVCKDTAVALDAGPGMFNYKWSNGNRTQTNSIVSAGKIWIEATSPAGCVMSDTLTISNYTLPELNLGQDTSLCGNVSITLSAPAGVDSYLWSNGAFTQSIPADSGQYHVTVEKFGCQFSDTIVIVKNVPSSVFSSDTIPSCSLLGTPLNGPSGMESYQWKRPSGAVENNQSIELSEQGWYILDFVNLCGVGTDSVFFSVPRFISSDTIISCADTVRIVANASINDAFVVNREYQWTDNFTRIDDTLYIYRSATYIVTGQYPGHPCALPQIFTVLVDTALTRPPLNINLGNDTSYCAGGVLPLDAGSGFDSYIWNTGSREAKTTAYGFGDYYVTARYCGYEYTDTITITEESSLVIKTLADTTICPDETVLLDAGDEFEWYEWSTGDTTQQVTVVPGQYTVRVGLNSCMATETVNVNAVPVNYMISGDSLLCVGETITLTATQHSGYDILWDSAGVQLADAGNVLLVSEAGTFRVKNEACPSSDWSIPFVVQEEQLSAPQFIYSPDSVCAGKPIQVGFNAGSYSSFEWNDGSTQNPKTFIAPASPVLTAYGVKCTEDFLPVIRVYDNQSCYIGIAESESCENAFSLIPNPSTSFVALSVQCDVKSPLTVSVLDYGMKNLGQVRGNLADANLLLNGLLQRLPAGGYVVRVTTEKSIFHLRWIIVR